MASVIKIEIRLSAELGDNLHFWRGYFYLMVSEKTRDLARVNCSRNLGKFRIRTFGLIIYNKEE